MKLLLHGVMDRQFRYTTVVGSLFPSQSSRNLLSRNNIIVTTTKYDSHTGTDQHLQFDYESPLKFYRLKIAVGPVFTCF